MRYATITEVYGSDFSAQRNNNLVAGAYGQSELLGPIQKQLPGHNTNGEDLEETNSVQNLTSYNTKNPPVHTRVNTRHHKPAHPAPSTVAAPGQHPGYMTKGLPPTQYKAVEQYNSNVYNPYYNNGPSKINDVDSYADHPLYRADLPCDVDNYPCEAYLAHFRKCAQCQMQLYQQQKKNSKEGFLNGLGTGDDMSDIILFILGALLVYLLLTRKNTFEML